MRTQKLIGTLAIAIFVLNLALPIAVFAADPIPHPYNWYKVVPGVLDTDTYILYPYELKSLNLGFSKYGELIGIPEGLDPTFQGNWVGLDYDGVDPFCPPDTVHMNVWINGWYIDIEYMAPPKTGLKSRDRHVWAYAMFADDQEWGGEWRNFTSIQNDTNVKGGRQTNKMAYTEDYEVLYDGPRRFVAKVVTHIYDYDEGLLASWPVADVVITIIFDKVKKEVILLKDVKLTLKTDWVDFQYPLVAVQFSNREQYDLPPSYYSYAHYYEQLGRTCYGSDWHVVENLTRKVYEIHHNATDPITSIELWQPPLVEGFIKLWVNGTFYEPGTYYDIDWNTGNITFKSSLLPLPRCSRVEVHYLRVYKNETEWNHKYDYAQFISQGAGHVAFAAIWPPASDYTVDGYRLKDFFWPLNCTAVSDMASEPWSSPLLIAEWDIAMSPYEGGISHFRGVEVKGVIDRHDADDEDMGTNHDDTLDREARYLLDEVFNPWDLVKAVHKETKRWVEYTDPIPSSGEYTTTHRPVIDVTDEDWDQYCVFSERVIDLSEGYELEARLGYNWRGQDYYTVSYNPDGTMTICGLEVGNKYKILYSTKPDVNKTISGSFEIIKGSLYLNTCETENMPVTDFNVEVDDNLGVWYGLTINMSETVSVHLKYNLTDWSVEGSLPVAKSWQEYDFKVPRKETYTSEIDDIVTLPRSITIEWYNGTEYIDVLEITNFDVKCISKLVSNKISDVVTWPIDGETVHILELEWTINSISYTINYNTTSDKLDITVKVDWTLYSHSKLGGRYEWTIVGKDAASVDSVGAALVTAALKNKQLEIGNAGLDMMEIPENLIPWVMRKFGAGNARSDYFMEPKVTVLSTSLPGTRASLKDDWCKTWPVASSNIISIGGPLANVLTSYINDFTDAYYATWDFSTETGYGYYKNGAVVALPCWSKNYYYSSQSKGYAVISTYKDLNGTVVFTIWGLWGRDTFYACKFFHEDIVYELQETCSRLRVDSTNSEPELIQVAPCYKFDHVTSIVVEIDYTSPEHPTFNIKEVLGTISEKLIIDWEGRYKGGLHPDP